MSVVSLATERNLRRPRNPVDDLPAGRSDAVEPVSRDAAGLETLVTELGRVHDSGAGPASISWLNHHSAMQVVRQTPETLESLTYIGVDGLFLRRILGADVSRTSADLAVPLLLPRLREPRVAVVGGHLSALPGVRRAVAELLPAGGSIVGCRDGYDGLPRGAELRRWLERTRPSVILAGLGAPLQEQFVVEAAQHLDRGLVITCGGFLDQVQQAAYYPSWAYPLKLNWAVRLAREPRRLWRRYTVDAMQAANARRELRAAVAGAPGFDALEQLTGVADFAGAAKEVASL